MRWLSNTIGLLEEFSPWGLLVAGGLVGLAAVPSAKLIARRAAVMTARGVLTLAGTAATVTERATDTVREGISSIVEEAREELAEMGNDEEMMDDDLPPETSTVTLVTSEHADKKSAVPTKPNKPKNGVKRNSPKKTNPSPLPTI